jgi:hypothetical protein
MDWLTFIAAIVKALAWPLTALAVLILIRRPLLRLIPLLRKLKWKELELEFEQKIIELKSEAAQALPAPPTRRQLTERTPSRLEQLAEISPRAAIIEAWIQLEHAASGALSQRLPDVSVTWSSGQIGELLAAHGLLDKNKLEVYNSLRKLRNQAAHHEDFTIPPKTALDYVVLAQALATYLGPNA